MKSHQTFARRLNVPFGLLVDSDWQYRLALGTPEPTKKEMKRITFVIDGKGVIRLIYYYEGKGNVANHMVQAYEEIQKIVG